MTNQELLKRLQALEAAERDVASSMDMPQERTANWEYAETAAIARSAILQQQEGLANYEEENQRLRAGLAELREYLRDRLGNDYARLIEDLERSALPTGSKA